MSELTYEKLKKDIKNTDLESAATTMLGLYIFDEEKFGKNLLLSGCLTDPLSRNFKEEELVFFLKACGLVLKCFEDGEGEYVEGFKNTVAKLYCTIKDINKASKSNEARLFKNDFLKYPFTKQIQMLCTFIESQSFYSNRDMGKRIHAQGYVTGMEHELPVSEKEVSVADIMEANLEIFDTLVRLLHYKANGKIDNQEIKSYNDISPFGIPSIEEIMHLALHRGFLEELWSRIKYQNWEFKRFKLDESNHVHYYCPPSDDDYKKERVAVIRYKYRDFINYSKRVNYKKMSETINELERASIFSLSSPSSVFKLDKDVFILGEKIAESAISVAWDQMEDDLGSLVDRIKIGKDKDINLNELYDGIKYLLSLAYVYRTNAHSKFDDKDFTYLSPIFELKDIKRHFSKLSGINIEKANNIIDLFVFRPKPLLDIFSQPLVYIGDERIVFTPHIVIQMNINRIVGKHLSCWGVDIAIKGTELEDEIKALLSFSSHFSINRSQVKFLAYDGKDVEYDLIATFGGKIILIEFKCLNHPFSPKEVKQRYDDILYGVSQVKRRENILIRQWEEVQKYIDIPLPKTPPKADDIVKIVCTNIFEFTGRIEEDVYITDVSSFIKFFLDPKIEEIKLELNTTSVISEAKLWSEEPTLEGLLEYLQSPIAVGGVLEKLKEVPREIPLIDKDDPHLAFKDYVLEENPYDFAVLSKYKDSYQGEKVGRNKPCPCGSGKKFKKCHGK
ncbi:SEC-C domain-containing protein [Bacillus haynesii]|nr:SEC-C domain-containing protein [Bacillus haynesii]MCY8102553.1 SEC-C domain-containing protein [Bacillus haynesii]MCY8469866.1 SEC-C domain-containing protein [Bacillus haynesii]